MHHGNRGSQRDTLHFAKGGHEQHADQTPEKNQLGSLEMGRCVFDANPHQ
jgi:hypothetical protein